MLLYSENSNYIWCLNHIAINEINNFYFKTHGNKCHNTIKTLTVFTTISFHPLQIATHNLKICYYLASKGDMFFQ